MASTRLSQLQLTVQPHQAFLLSNPADLYYFADFENLLSEEREGFLVVTREKSYLIQATFSPSPNRSDLTILKGCSAQHLEHYLKTVSKDHSLEIMYLDEEHLSVKEYRALSSLPIKLEPLASELIWKYRMVKDEEEQNSIKEAARIVTHCIKSVLKNLKVGQTELELRNHFVQELLLAGAQAEAFPTIIAFGDHSALPHHQPTSRALDNNMAVLIDAGVKVKNYRSDMTRTVWFGPKPPDEFQQISQVVHEAYQEAYKELADFETNGISASDIDKVARNYITNAGFGPQFNHTTGHGVGLDIHEPPSLNSTNHTPLLPGMVVTIEPGIYLDGTFGYRFENTVLLSKDSGIELTGL